MVDREIRWEVLTAGLVCTVMVGLGVHVVLQQVLHVPYPSNYPRHVWLEHVDQAMIVLGLLLLLSWSADTLEKLSFIARWLVLFVLYAMLRETLRGALMEGVVTTAYVFPLLSMVPKLLGFLVLTLLSVAVQPMLARMWQKVVAAGVIYAAVTFAVQPLINHLLEALLAHFSYLQHDEVYPAPYGAHVLIPAYLTFVEPAIACVACAALVGSGLAKRPSRPWVQFILLVLLLRRSLFPPFIYALYQPQHRTLAFISAGQFSLETIALALLAVLTWRYGASYKHLPI
jgi:hypothetical protein